MRSFLQKNTPTHTAPTYCSTIDHVKKVVNATLPDYAKADEAAVFELTADEYDRIVRKYGKLHGVSVEVEDISAKAGQEVTLPETVNIPCLQSDG